MDDLFVAACGVGYTHKKGFTFSEGTHPDCFLLTFFLTDYLAETKNGVERGRAESFLLFAPDTSLYHTNVPEATVGFTDDWCYFSGREAFRTVRDLGIPLNEIVPVRPGRPITELIRQIQRDLSEKQSFYHERMQAHLMILLTELARAAEEKETYSGLGQLCDVRERMLRDYTRKWTVAELAAQAGYSPSHFAAVYQKTFGISPIDELITFRLTQAQQQLESRTLPVSEVARRCGFGSVYYFSRAFKQQFGVSPMQYLRAGDKKNGFMDPL